MKTNVIMAALLLSAASLLADADLRTRIIASDRVFRAGFHYATVRISVTNFGTDTAVGVKFSVTSSIPVTCTCPDEDIPPGQNRERSFAFDAPLTSGPVTFTANATSSTPDANQNDNTVSVALNVSADPDLILGNSAIPIAQPIDLALPFTPTITIQNFGKVTTAHDVDVTLDFSVDVGVQSLPEGCSAPATGRISCRIAEIAPTGLVALKPVLVGPAAYGGGSITITATAIERETDFDPVSNKTVFTLPLYKTMYVTTTADSGAGSLRQAILDANAGCGGAPCTIASRIGEPTEAPWKTIRLSSPLPALTVPFIRMDGATQTAFFGNTNAGGPEIEISGGGSVDGDGLTLVNCDPEVANLAINGFGNNGISVLDAVGAPGKCASFPAATLHHLFIGTDPTGTMARPNLRGIGTSFRNGPGFVRPAAIVTDSVISGNTRSGIFGLSGALIVSRNRIGVQAHADEPLPNGNAGVYVGLGGSGSDIGAITRDPFGQALLNEGNVIAFNGQMGIAVAAGLNWVSVRNNRMWGNGGLGIDIGLDGATPAGTLPAPVLTLAHYDPTTNQTVIEANLVNVDPTYNSILVDFYANDAPNDQGQRPLGSTRITGLTPQHVRFTADGDLTGQRITATTTRIVYQPFDTIAPAGVTNDVMTQTSEISRPIEVR